MRIFVVSFYFLVVGFGFTSCGGVAQADSSIASRFKAALYHRRILLLFSRGELETELVRQRQIFENKKGELTERDLIIFSLTDQDRDTDWLRKKYNPRGKKFQFVLIGKDGGIKKESSLAVPAEELFSLVDAMPMRQDEVKKKEDSF